MTRCWLSENHVAITTTGRVLPCTRYKKTEGPNIFDQNLNQIWNGDWLNEIRTELQAGNKIDGCRKCWQQEDNGVQSMRQVYDGNWTNKLQSIEIALSNHCNYACRHCNSFSSSKWYDDDKALGRNTPNRKLVELDIDTINDISNITNYKFLGGEPLINKSHEKLLTKIDNIENVVLEYTTNGSIYPNETIIDIWKRAKRVKLTVSLDDIYEGFNYFRSGGDFDTVIDNCKKFQLLDINYKFHIVLNALNLHRMPIILSYLEQNFPSWYIHFDRVDLPLYLRTGQWSKYEGEKVIQKINNQRLVKLIKQECVNDVSDITDLIKTNTILDKRRNTDMFEIYPILEQFL